MYLTFVCLMPEFLISKYPIPFYLGGTSILIVVVVAMDTVTLSENEFSTTFIYAVTTIVGSLGLAWSGYKIGFSLFS